MPEWHTEGKGSSQYQWETPGWRLFAVTILYNLHANVVSEVLTATQNITLAYNFSCMLLSYCNLYNFTACLIAVTYTCCSAWMTFSI